MAKIPRPQSVAEALNMAINQMRIAADALNKQADELERALYIAKRLQAGARQSDIAVELNISPGRVSQIWSAQLKDLTGSKQQS